MAKDYKLLSATAFSLLILAVLVSANIFLAAGMAELWVSALVILLGVTLGWSMGTFTSPYNEAESMRFGAITKASGLFISGYLVGKADSLFTYVLAPNFVLSYGSGVRILSFLIALTASFHLTYVHRKYAPNTRMANNPTDAA